MSEFILFPMEPGWKLPSGFLLQYQLPVLSTRCSSGRKSTLVVIHRTRTDNNLVIQRNLKGTCARPLVSGACIKQRDSYPNRTTRYLRIQAWFQ
jgi:hypothetical protein